MAYNNNFPMGYQPQPMYYQPQIVQPSNAQVPQSNLTWVQGEAGAKSYLVAPNTTVQLWDSEKQVIYIKSADASGMPTMKVLDYTIRDNQNTPTNALEGSKTDFITRDDILSIEEHIKALEKRIESLSNRKNNYNNNKGKVIKDE